MSNDEMRKFHGILEGLVLELTRSTRRRDAITIENSAEELERRLGASERELAMQHLETESIKLRETRAALRRIKDGTFGICQECAEPINPKRMAALPTAAFCIICQELMDCHCGAKNNWMAFPMAA